MAGDDGLTRRTFLERAGVAALSAGLAARPRTSHAQLAVPNSSGTAPPQLKTPPRACDCHMHIYDPARFPMPPSQRVAPTNAAVPQYRLLQKRIGTTRVVIVTPRNYATDNRVTVDAIAQLAPNARGVAVIHPTITDAELKELHGGGIRGIRFSLTDPATAVVTFDMIEPLAKRVAGLGWHVQINMTADQIAAAEALWKRLPSPIVFDHIGQLPGSVGVAHPAYTVMRRLLDVGRAWVKLSVTYSNTTDGPPGYADVVRVGQAFVKAAPERLVWGSNWPHPNETRKPDDALLFDLMARWAPDEATRRRILVDNPRTLYDFADA
ncbi:MAG: amidohydrolase family protein [Acidobacteria bacterium]|nr:amidohydrolase family protein [Acidobacteriota bacterium]